MEGGENMTIRLNGVSHKFNVNTTKERMLALRLMVGIEGELKSPQRRREATVVSFNKPH